jgi:hypothetical protein
VNICIIKKKPNPTYAMNDYQLNLEKSLEKKLIAAKRVKSLNYE